MATEKIVLRKGSAARHLTLDGSALTVKIGAAKPKRTSYSSGVMARSKRDAMVRELEAAGWASEAAKSKTKKKPARALDVKVEGKATPIKTLPKLKTEWPADYADILARFGTGILEDLIILSNAHVVKRTKMWRTKTAPVAATLWPNLDIDASKLVVIAASQNGDWLGFVEPNALLLFPRGSDRVLTIGSTFAEALATWCFGDEIGEPRATKKARFTPLA